MRKIALVTGAFGFVGRHMVEELRSRGYLTVGWDLPTYNLLDQVQMVNTSFDLVVHCAYNVGGRAGIDGKNLNFMKNLMLDAALFGWAAQTQQKRVLYFSSSAAYPVYYQEKAHFDMVSSWMQGDGLLSKDEASAELRLREESWDELEPAWADANYGYAKCVGERLAQNARENGLAVTVVRPFSGYGEDQSHDYPFPSIVRRAQTGDLTVWGPPGQTRDWIHISDVVNGALAVADSGTEDPVNLCTGRGVEMGQLAQMAYAQDRWGCACCHTAPSMPQPIYDESKPTGVFYRVGDPTRMLKYYEPKVTLEEGIARALL